MHLPVFKIKYYQQQDRQIKKNSSLNIKTEILMLLLMHREIISLHLCCRQRVLEKQLP